MHTFLKDPQGRFALDRMRPCIYYKAMDFLSLFTIIFILALPIFLVLVSLLGLIWALSALCRRCGRKRDRSGKLPQNETDKKTGSR